jgi:hypothetical protein
VRSNILASRSDYLKYNTGIAPVSTHSSRDNGDDAGATETCRKEVKEKLISAYDRHIATPLKTEICSVDPATLRYTREMGSVARKRAGEWSTSWWEQFSVLLRRGLRERRHESFSKLRIFQVLSVAFLGGLLWWHTPQNHIQDRVHKKKLHITLIDGNLNKKLSVHIFF